MIEIKCDKCGKDCGRNTYVITVNEISNPNPLNYNDFGNATISNSDKKMRFVLCSEHYRELGFPNINSLETKGLIFKDIKQYPNQFLGCPDANDFKSQLFEVYSAGFEAGMKNEKDISSSYKDIAFSYNEFWKQITKGI